MTVTVQFYSYFRDLTDCASASMTLDHGATLADLTQQLHERFPKLKPMERSTLRAVGVEYQRDDYVLQDGDEISFFPPVQGG